MKRTVPFFIGIINVDAPHSQLFLRFETPILTNIFLRFKTPILLLK